MRRWPASTGPRWPARVGALPAVEQATVTRNWPDGLTIVVVERTPEAVVAQGKRFLVVDRFGVVFQDLNRRPAHLPLVRIADPRGDATAPVARST